MLMICIQASVPSRGCSNKATSAERPRRCLLHSPQSMWTLDLVAQAHSPLRLVSGCVCYCYVLQLIVQASCSCTCKSAPWECNLLGLRSTAQNNIVPHKSASGLPASLVGSGTCCAPVAQLIIARCCRECQVLDVPDQTAHGTSLLNPGAR